MLRLIGVARRSRAKAPPHIEVDKPGDEAVAREGARMALMLVLASRTVLPW